jgi:hypothetical protein
VPPPTDETLGNERESRDQVRDERRRIRGGLTLPAMS